MIWKKVFEVVKLRGENRLTRKSFENVFSSQHIEFPFFKTERLLELFFLSLFSMLFFSLFLCSDSLLRMNSRIFEMFEEKKIQTFFQMGWKWLYQDLCNWGICEKFIDSGCIP
jgi:hypothetical protein